MKRVLIIIGALLAIVVVVIVLRVPAAVDPNALVTPTAPQAGATTIDLGDGWSAEVRPDSGLSCVVLRNDVAQTRCVPASTLEGGYQAWTSSGRGLRVSVAFVGSNTALTAQWSASVPVACCGGAMFEIEPNVWLSYLATPDDDEHWGVQMRDLDGSLRGEYSLLPPG